MPLNDTATITLDERARIRRHTGYLNVAEASTFALGLPAGVQTQFIIEGAMDKVLQEALPILREQLAICDQIWSQMVNDLELLAVSKVGSIDIRSDEQEALTKRYLFHRADLCNTLGVIPNPYDARFGGSGPAFINVPVLHG